ncbi:MAG: hypothetical protein IH960_07990 [Chloroflexi bacterium]|nr:hypothetical protein [Chloroflexota bacterium]
MSNNGNAATGLINAIANLFRQAATLVQAFGQSPVAGIKAIGTLTLSIIFLLAAVIAIREMSVELAYAGAITSGIILFAVLLAFVTIDTA